MTPMDRLLQEAIPVRPERPDGTHSLWTKQEQDRHWDDLCRAIGAPNHRKHPRRKHPRRTQPGDNASEAA